MFSGTLFAPTVLHAKLLRDENLKCLSTSHSYRTGYCSVAIARAERLALPGAPSDHKNDQLQTEKNQTEALSVRQAQQKPGTISQQIPEGPSSAPLLLADSDHPLVKDVQLALVSLFQPGELKWQISDSLSLDGKVLSAPTPQTLSNAPELKKQLWQLLQQHL